MADKTDNVEIHVARAMQINVASTTDTCRTPQHLGKDASRCHAAHKVTAHVTVHWRNNVICFQRIPSGNTDRFMPALAKDSTQSASLSPIGNHGIVIGACQTHPIVEFEPLL